MIYDQILKAENLSSMDPAIFIQKMFTFLILLKGNTEEVLVRPAGLEPAVFSSGG
jgi:hypothetical protein